MLMSDEAFAALVERLKPAMRQAVIDYMEETGTAMLKDEMTDFDHLWLKCWHNVFGERGDAGPTPPGEPLPVTEASQSEAA